MPRNRENPLTQIATMLVGVVATIAFQRYVAAALESGGFLRRLFLPPGDWFQRFIPSLILFLFFCSIADLLFKTWKVNSHQRQLKHKNVRKLREAIRLQRDEDTVRLTEWLRKRAVRGFVFDRVWSLVDSLFSRRDVQRSHEFFRHQSDVDADNAASTYTTVRIFIWAMPILGFIGTVIGIGLAVGNFSGFLTGDIDDVGIVKAELAKIAGGLSFAFDTTLLGLTASLIAMLVTSFVQKSDERVLGDVEELGLEIISNFRGKAAASGLQGPTVAAPEDATAIVRDEISKATELINELQAAVQQASAEFKSFPDTMRTSGENLTKQIDGLSTELERSADSFRQAAESWIGDESTDSMIASVTRFTGVIGDQTRRISGGIEGFADSIDSLTSEVERLTPRVERYEVSLSEEVNGLLDKINRLTTTVTDLKGGLDSVVSARDLTLAGIRSLETLRDLIEEMQEGQTGIARILNKLGGPLDIRLVPRGETDPVTSADADA